MSICKLASLGLVLSLSGSCSPGSKMVSGNEPRGEASPSREEAELRMEPRSVSESSLDAVEQAPVPSSPEADPEVDDSSNSIAGEPVPIGGSYLTCRYQSAQPQGGETYKMDCTLMPSFDLSALVATIQFFKVDNQGVQAPLTIVDQDLLALRWTLQENAATVPYNRVQLIVNALGAISVNVTLPLQKPLNLIRNTAYWLANEPGNGADEDCVEFSNAAMKLSHQNTTGMTSGPLGRLNDISCNTRSNFLCRNMSAGPDVEKWKLSETTGVFADGANACPQGYAFGFPLNETDVREVSALVDRNERAMNIWVNLNDRANENSFIAFEL